MLVVMIAIGGMPMPVMGVVDVVAVRDRLVAAAGTVDVTVTRMGQVRERVLVVVVIMRRVGVPFVHVVDVSFALSARVPAAWPVYVVVIVNVMISECHPSSLL